MTKNYSINIIKMPDVTELASEKVMIDYDSGKYFMLTGSANDIWDLFQKDIKTSQEIVKGLLELYDVPEDVCATEVLDFLKKLEEIGFIKIEELA